MGLVVAERFSFPHEAEIARASLEAAGVPAVVADQHHINANWLVSNALGGVRLLVPEEALDFAKELLAADFSYAVDAELGRDTETCSACGSSDLEPFTKGKRSAFVVFLFAGFPLFFYKHGMRCKSCGHFDPA
ncbi:MAG: DUF2007 domain-containing protein [Pseudomonadota bacterium]